VKEDHFAPLTTQSLKDLVVERFERLILSGEFPIGKKLPPERDLARRLSVSRPVIHEGLVELSLRGLVRIVPRKGCFVGDYRREGSLELLVSLVNYQGSSMDPVLLKSIMAMRMLFETETARCAAAHRSTRDLAEFHTLLEEESSVNLEDPVAVALIDYRFHHQIALASGNTIYPLLVTSFKPLYLSILERFYMDGSVIPPIFECHRAIAEAVRAGDPVRALEEMKGLLVFSEENLYRILEESRAP